MELTVLGASGSYGAPRGGACSGYLLRDGDTTIWMDCGNGTFPLLQEHVEHAQEIEVQVLNMNVIHFERDNTSFPSWRPVTYLTLRLVGAPVAQAPPNSMTGTIEGTAP